MPPNIHRKLNVLFKQDGDEKYLELLHWAKWGDMPTHRFILKGDFFRDLIVNEDDELVYEPENLIVLPEGRKPQILAEAYADLSKSAGKGPTTFYKRLCEDYANFSRKEVTEFIRKQPSYQIRTVPRKGTNRPIYARYAS